MAKRLDLPEETLEQIKALLKEKSESKFWSYKLSFAGIAEATGTTKDIVENISYRRANAPTDRKIRKKLTPKEVKEIKDILCHRDFMESNRPTYKEISEKTGIPAYTIQAINHGICYANTGD